MKKKNNKDVLKLNESIHQEFVDQILDQWNEPEVDLYEYCPFDCVADDTFCNWSCEDEKSAEYFINGVLDADLLQQMITEQVVGLKDKLANCKSLQRQLESICEEMVETHSIYRDDAIVQKEQEEQDRLDAIAEEEEERRLEEEERRLEEENNIKLQQKKQAQAALLKKLDPEIREALSIAFDLDLNLDNKKIVKSKSKKPNKIAC